MRRGPRNPCTSATSCSTKAKQIVRKLSAPPCVQVGYETNTVDAMQLTAAERVLSVLMVPGMFTLAYPIQAVHLEGQAYEAVYDDYDIKHVLYPTLHHWVAYTRAVLQAGRPDLKTLLGLFLPPGYQAPLQEACHSRQVRLPV